MEHAFQAAKTFDRTEKQSVGQAATPGLAKRLGRKVRLRPDWEQVKIGIMEELVRLKFTREGSYDPQKRCLTSKQRSVDATGAEDLRFLPSSIGSLALRPDGKLLLRQPRTPDSRRCVNAP